MPFIVRVPGGHALEADEDGYLDTHESGGYHDYATCVACGNSQCIHCNEGFLSEVCTERPPALPGLDYEEFS